MYQSVIKSINKSEIFIIIDENKSQNMWVVKIHYKKRLRCDVHVYVKALGYMGSILTMIRTAKENKRKEKKRKEKKKWREC